MPLSILLKLDELICYNTLPLWRWRSWGRPYWSCRQWESCEAGRALCSSCIWVPARGTACRRCWWPMLAEGCPSEAISPLACLWDRCSPWLHNYSPYSASLTQCGVIVSLLQVKQVKWVLSRGIRPASSWPFWMSKSHQNTVSYISQKRQRKKKNLWNRMSTWFQMKASLRSHTDFTCCHWLHEAGTQMKGTMHSKEQICKITKVWYAKLPIQCSILHNSICSYTCTSFSCRIVERGTTQSMWINLHHLSNIASQSTDSCTREETHFLSDISSMPSLKHTE